MPGRSHVSGQSAGILKFSKCAQWISRAITKDIRCCTHLLKMELTAKNHSIPLSDGNNIPLIGLGTYGNPQMVRQAVYTDRIHYLSI